jgi:hypothetical protein
VCVEQERSWVKRRELAIVEKGVLIIIKNGRRG